jgi:hypothetical protein
VPSPAASTMARFGAVLIAEISAISGIALCAFCLTCPLPYGASTCLRMSENRRPLFRDMR